MQRPFFAGFGDFGRGPGFGDFGAGPGLPPSAPAVIVPFPRSRVTKSNCVPAPSPGAVLKVTVSVLASVVRVKQPNEWASPQPPLLCLHPRVRLRPSVV
jgi:hypothetical protein